MRLATWQENGHLAVMRNLDRLYVDLPYFRAGTASAYLLAAAICALAIFLRLVLDPWVTGIQVLALLPGVIAATLVCGARAGLLAIVLSGVGTWFFVQPPAWSFKAIATEQAIALALFLAVAMFAVAIIGAMRLSIARHQDLTRSLEKEVARRAAELQASEERFRAIFDAAFQLTGVCELDGRIIVVNRAALDAVGARQEDVVGLTVWESPLWSGAPAEADRLKDAVARVRRGELVRYRTELVLPGGATRMFDLSVKPVLRDGVPAYLVAEGRDITELTEAEARLAQAQKMEALGQLTGGVAHDFNNMLTIVIGSLDLARRRLAQGRADVERYLDNATEGANRAALLTQRLLAFSRRQALVPVVVDLNKLVQDMADLLRRTLGEAVIVECVVAGGLWRSRVDPGQLESAIVNLAVNARDAMPGGGKLTVETANAHLDDGYAAEHAEVDPGQYAVIAVTDTGIGMTPDIVARAFEPFFTTKEAGRGTGLGLSQVYGFVKQSGGHVKIYSEPDRGTTVKLYLPRHRGAEAPSRLDGPPVTEPLPPLGPHQDVILVVEDDERVRRTTVAALRELGYVVRHAASGAEALAVLDRLAGITLLLTDVVMAGMDGRALAEEALRRRPDLKVLYTTGYSRNAIVHQGTLDPGVALLPKPFTIDQLARKVRTVLDGGSVIHK